MKGLGHGAEVFAQAAGLARGEAQRTARRLAVEPKQTRRARRRADRAAGRGAVEPLLIMSRQDRFGDLALHFHADLIRRHESLAAQPGALRQREHRGQRRCRGVGQQAVDSILGHRELRVIVVVGVDRQAIRKRRETGRQTQWAADDGAAAIGRDAKRSEIATHNVRAFRRGAGQRETEPVQHGTLAQVDDIGRNVARLGRDDEVRDIGTERGIGSIACGNGIAGHR